MYPTLEITMPISPTRMMLLSRESYAEFFDVDAADLNQRLIDELNRRTCRCARETIVVSRNEYRRHWAEAGELPPDAWEVRADG